MRTLNVRRGVLQPPEPTEEEQASVDRALEDAAIGGTPTVRERLEHHSSDESLRGTAATVETEPVSHQTDAEEDAMRARREESGQAVPRSSHGIVRELSIDGVLINDDSDCFVIAEIGHNHQGSIEQAKAMFERAKECGAHAVKLQKRDNRALFTEAYYNRPYDHENSFGPTYGEHREALEFGRDEYVELMRYAEELELIFFATAFDHPSADFLAHLEMPAYSVASADLTNTPLLRYVAEIGKPMIISTGGATLDEVLFAYEAITSINSEVAILQSSASYPPAWDQLDLAVIEAYRHLFPETVVGLSSNDTGIATAVAAYVLGARIIEKHFTLSRTMKGSDHAFSLEPQGMQKLTRDLRRIRLALGDGTKRRYPSEEEPITKMGKKLVAARDLPAGHTLGEDDIIAKSPGDGLAPYHLDRVIGLTLTQPLERDAALSFALVEKELADPVAGGGT